MGYKVKKNVLLLQRLQRNEMKRNVSKYFRVIFVQRCWCCVVMSEAIRDINTRFNKQPTLYSRFFFVLSYPSMFCKLKFYAFNINEFAERFPPTKKY
jgi:hypothetical protein